MMISVRAATGADAEAIASIYAFHVLNGTATFEIDPPRVADWQLKIETILAKNWPFVVAQDGLQIVGYAYATQFRDRPAYRYACENSIYIAATRRGQGFGKLLLAALVQRAEDFGFRQMLAVVGGGEPSSIAVHKSLGFREMGRMKAVGRKFEKWLDTVYMQRALGEGDAEI
jgi:L-amino acid N-acyltransferase YncA